MIELTEIESKNINLTDNTYETWIFEVSIPKFYIDNKKYSFSAEVTRDRFKDSEVQEYWIYDKHNKEVLGLLSQDVLKTIAELTVLEYENDHNIHLSTYE